jgi:hypothetical protein
MEQMMRNKQLTVQAALLTALACAFSFASPALGQQAGKLFFEGDLVKGPQPGQAGPFCVLQSQFFRKQQVVWRVRVLDLDRNQVDEKGLRSLVVELSNGKKIDLKFKPHPPRGTPTDYFWSGSWVIPEDHPTGSLSYKVVATDNQGHTQVWEPFKMASSQLAVIPGNPPMAKQAQ